MIPSISGYDPRWKKFDKSDEEIDLIIDSGKHIGEKFYDCNQDQSIWRFDVFVDHVFDRQLIFRFSIVNDTG